MAETRKAAFGRPTQHDVLEGKSIELSGFTRADCVAFSGGVRSERGTCGAIVTGQVGSATRPWRGSKTSKEVVKIYDAIRLLECQLFPKTKKISGQHLLDTLNQRIEAGTRKIEKLGGAPAEVRAQHAGLLSELQKRAAEVTEELAFIEVCLAAIEPRLEPAEHEPEQGESTAPE